MAEDIEQDATELPGSPGRRGTNQSGMRASNERLVLSLVRQNKALSKTEIARMTGLSAQTVSVIMRQLEADHLLKRGAPMRGRVGQPSVPLSLDPDGAYFLGAKIGRRSLEVVLVDFLGSVRHAVFDRHAFPRPEPVITRICQEAAACEVLLGGRARRIAGLGIALPFALWDWAEEIGAPIAEMAAWRNLDLRQELETRLPYPVYLQNDATAACGAELAFGTNTALRDFLYFYVGTFVGGGIVLNGGLYVGRTGNAGALGSMPVPGPEGSIEQLIDQTSISVLERRVREVGGTVPAGPSEEAWLQLGKPLDDWIDMAARGLAYAIVAATSVFDFETAVVDGTFPAAVRGRLVAAILGHMSLLDTAGLDLPSLREGSIGPMARALGGASLPLFDRFLVDRSAPVGQGPPRKPT